MNPGPSVGATDALTTELRAFIFSTTLSYNINYSTMTDDVSTITMFLVSLLSVDVSEQEDEGSESVSRSDVEQSPWYNADLIAFAVSDSEKVDRIHSVWNSIDAIVGCSQVEWKEK